MQGKALMSKEHKSNPWAITRTDKCVEFCVLVFFVWAGFGFFSLFFFFFPEVHIFNFFLCLPLLKSITFLMTYAAAAACRHTGFEQKELLSIEVLKHRSKPLHCSRPAASPLITVQPSFLWKNKHFHLNK